MRFTKDVNDNGSDFKRGSQNPVENPVADENKELSASKLEDNDASNCVLEPSATALIPPWIRSSLGLSEKGSKPNQKCFKTLPASSERGFTVETAELKADSDDEYTKTNVHTKDSSSASPIIEVNIGHETDFPEDNPNLGSKLSVWKSKGCKRNQYECNIFGMCKDKRLARAVKSEVTSIDVVVPIDDHEDERKKVRPHKMKNKMYKRISLGGLRSEELSNGDANTRNRDMQKRDFTPNGMRKLDSRLLLLCGKNTIDSLTEDDVSLLQEMKNQIGHKEGLEKLFSEIKEMNLLDRSPEIVKTKKDDGEKMKREATKVIDSTKFIPNADEGDTKIVTSLMNKTKMMEEERKYLEEIKRHYEKKKLNQPKKYVEEAEPEKNYRVQQRAREAERKKLRHGDYSMIEKAVNETLHRFLEVYRFQIPPDTVSSMKKNIVQTLQSEYAEPRKNMDVMLNVQEQMKAETNRNTTHSLILEEKEDKTKNIPKPVPEAVHPFTEDENLVSKDAPNEEAKMPFRTILVNSEKNIAKENDVIEDENVKDLKKVFEKCLSSIQTQMDITSAKLCTLVLEKVEDDKPDTNMRIVYNITNGIAESIKIYKEKMSMGSPEGDNVNTSMKFCDCQRLEQKIKCNQSCQTNDKAVTESSNQTECLDFPPIKEIKSADFAPGLYRIIKATELGRLYLCPEIGDDDIQRTNSEVYDPPENAFFNDLSESLSRETFISERIPPKNTTLQRAVRSDCLGLNSCDLIRRDSVIINEVLKHEEGEKENKEVLVRAEGEEEKEEEVEGTEDNEAKENPVSNSQSYHVGCVWLWNGKKMDPGVDLKVHVEDLLREKIKEILGEVKTEESKSVGTESTSIGDGLEKNLEIRETRTTFCLSNKRPFDSDVTPFIFGRSYVENREMEMEVPIGRNESLKLQTEACSGKSVREVGTQNSQHTIVSLNITKVKPRPKLCTFAKISKQRCRKQIYTTRGRMERNRLPGKAFSFAENVGEAKKVKLEIRESNEVASNNERGSNTESVRECFSIISNGSSSSTDGPVRVKLIGIEVSKEKKSPGDGEFFDNVSEMKTLSGNEYKSKEKLDGLLREQSKRHKHWELIENVLNRVNQKEKDGLWNDIREFVKKKIGRDINDDGAREVCIEIEQDVPKFAKGKSSQAVVARGNYSRNEGDVEVEVDLTLDDLEWILRHRRKKQRRRQKSQNQKPQLELKKSTSSSRTSLGVSDSMLTYSNFMNSSSAFDGYVTPSEIKILKQRRLWRNPRYQQETPVEIDPSIRRA